MKTHSAGICRSPTSLMWPTCSIVCSPQGVPFGCERQNIEVNRHFLATVACFRIVRPLHHFSSLQGNPSTSLLLISYPFPPNWSYRPHRQAKMRHGTNPMATSVSFEATVATHNLRVPIFAVPHCCASLKLHLPHLGFQPGISGAFSINGSDQHVNVQLDQESGCHPSVPPFSAPNNPVPGSRGH